MYYLIIDTCVWLDMYDEQHEIIEKIKSFIDKKNITLILPDLVREEWDRNKNVHIERARQSIRSKIKNAKDLSLHLDPLEAHSFKDVVTNIEEKIEAAVQVGIQEIEYLLTHPTTICPEVTDVVKLQAVAMALAKKAPFKNDNSMADALIVLSSVDYIDKNQLKNCFFISSNVHDFSLDNKNRDVVHEDLRELFEKHSITYHIIIGRAINEIALAINEAESNLISEESIKKVEERVEENIQIESIVEANSAFIRAASSAGIASNMFDNLTAMGGVSSMARAVEAAEVVNRRLLDNLTAMGGVSSMARAVEAAEVVNRRLLDNLTTMGGVSSMARAAEAAEVVNRRLLDNLTAMGGVSSMARAVEAAEVVNRKLLDNLTTMGGVSSMARAAEAAEVVNRRLLDNLTAMGGVSSMARAAEAAEAVNRKLMKNIGGE